jgi:hypothetical protein
MNNHTYIGCPTHNGEMRGDIASVILDCVAGGDRIAFCHHKYSKLTQNFNMLLCDAINRKIYTHFLMIHGDIVPAEGWFRKMHAVMEEVGADILSAVVPIKTMKGVTSTGYCVEETVPLKIRRLTLAEIHQMPETFTHEHLIVNTGLMLINLRAPFVENVGKGLAFRVTDQILTMPDGSLKAFGGSEDWLFSLDARKLGAKIFATRAVKVNHVGGHSFSNAEAYGIPSEDWKQS